MWIEICKSNKKKNLNLQMVRVLGKLQKREGTLYQNAQNWYFWSNDKNSLFELEKTWSSHWYDVNKLYLLEGTTGPYLLMEQR